MTLFALGGYGASAQMFTVSNNGPLSVVSGHSGTFNATVTPTGSFSGTVLISCVNLPVNSECFFPNGNNGLAVNNAAASMTVTLDTATVYNYEVKATPPLRRGLEQVALCSLFAPAVCVLFLGRRRMRITPAIRMMVCALVLLPLAGLVGCAATKPPVTPAGNYQVTVSATSNVTGVTASSVLSLVVTNP